MPTPPSDSSTIPLYAQVTVHSKDGVPLGEMHDLISMRRSWLLGKSGQCVFEIWAGHPKDTYELLRKHNIVVVLSNRLKPWKGYITSVTQTGDIKTVTCTSELQMLGRRRTDVVDYEDEPVGDIYSDLINRANAHGATGLYVGSVFTAGKNHSLQVRRENVYDKLQELIEDTKLELEVVYVNPAASLLHLREKVGQDRTDSVCIIGGFDTSQDPDYEEDMGSEHANVITGVGSVDEEEEIPEGEDEYDYRPTFTHSDWESVAEYGITEDTEEYSDVTDEDAVEELVRESVAVRSSESRKLGLATVEKRELWGQFYEGDVIAAQLPHYGFTGLAVPVRVSGLEVDEESAALTITGDVVTGAKAHTLAMFRFMHYGSGGAGDKIKPQPETPASATE